MTTLHALRRRLADIGPYLKVASAAVDQLASMPVDDLPITEQQGARLLIRADKLADRIEALADELAALAPLKSEA